MKLQPKDIGIIVAVVIVGVAATVVTTKVFGSDHAQKPEVLAQPSKEKPSAPGTNKPVDMPNQTAN